MTALDEAVQALQKMPRTATWDEIRYEIYVRAKIAQGQRDAAEGNVVSQEEVEKDFPE